MESMPMPQTSPFEAVFTVFGVLLMLALVVAGLALTWTALRRDLKQRKRRYRRRRAVEQVPPARPSQGV
jgi:hypothetical protein